MTITASYEGQRHKRLSDWARQVLVQLARWLPDRRIIVVTDSSYAALELLDAVRRRVCMVTRLRLDARLFAPPPQRLPGTIGRPRLVGERLPTLAQRSADPATPWCRLVSQGWYGGGERVVEIASGAAVWHHPGLPVVPLRPSPALAGDPCGTGSMPQASMGAGPRPGG